MDRRLQTLPSVVLTAIALLVGCGPEYRAACQVTRVDVLAVDPISLQDGPPALAADRWTLWPHPGGAVALRAGSDPDSGTPDGTMVELGTGGPGIHFALPASVQPGWLVPVAGRPVQLRTETVPVFAPDGGLAEATHLVWTALDPMEAARTIPESECLGCLEQVELAKIGTDLAVHLRQLPLDSTGPSTADELLLVLGTGGEVRAKETLAPGAAWRLEAGPHPDAIALRGEGLTLLDADLRPLGSVPLPDDPTDAVDWSLPEGEVVRVFAQQPPGSTASDLLAARLGLDGSERLAPSRFSQGDPGQSLLQPGLLRALRSSRGMAVVFSGLTEAYFAELDSEGRKRGPDLPLPFPLLPQEGALLREVAPGIYQVIGQTERGLEASEVRCD